MNRPTLLAELHARGIRPPAAIDNDTLFEVVDASRRAHCENPRIGTPEVEVWPHGRDLSRALFLMS